MAFSYHAHQPLFTDSACFPNSPILMPFLQQEVGQEENSSCFSYLYSSAEMPELSLTNATAQYDNSSTSLETCTNTLSPSTNISISKTAECQKKKKRKTKDETNLIISNRSKSTKDSRNCKQERERSIEMETEKKRKPKADDLKDSETGYIHVRARRGQATDSHSLAERVRREKISEKMKMLQGLVPGCDKVTGKAHMLDEIINYVQSLQNQVEFLSMRLASLSPVLYEFGLDLHDCISQPEIMRRTTKDSSMDLAIDIPATTFENNTNNYQMMLDHLEPHLLQGLEPTSLVQQDVGSSLMQVDAQRQVFLNQREFTNMSSF